MNQLETFSQFLKGEETVKLSGFSTDVIQDLKKTKQSLKNEGTTLDIEGVNVERSENKEENQTTITYKGDFIYGFQKDNIFHELPGDLSSKKERKINENGTVKFIIKNSTGKIESIYESFAGNTWGEKQKKKSWGKIILIILALYIAYNLFG